MGYNRIDINWGLGYVEALHQVCSAANTSGYEEYHLKIHLPLGPLVFSEGGSNPLCLITSLFSFILFFYFCHIGWHLTTRKTKNGSHIWKGLMKITHYGRTKVRRQSKRNLKVNISVNISKKKKFNLPTRREIQSKRKSHLSSVRLVKIERVLTRWGRCVRRKHWLLMRFVWTAAQMWWKEADVCNDSWFGD